MSNSAIDIRMKDYYEKRADYSLTRRTPVILRVDGRAFHTFVHNFKKPYDEVLHETMNNTMLALCKEIQGAKLAYTQSDEISILITDYDTLETNAWFDYRIQKMCSIAASTATLAFNKALPKAIKKFYGEFWIEAETPEDAKYVDTLIKALDKGAMFDARCFNIPEEEIVNYFISRQQDATRNSIKTAVECTRDYPLIKEKWKSRSMT